jgi:hypothetical protein
MRSEITRRVLAAALLLAPGLAFAQTVPTPSGSAPGAPPTAEQREQMRQRWQNMTPEERQKAQEQFRARRAEREKNMTPEQRAEMEKRRAEARDRWEKMTPEEREQARKRFQERRGPAVPPAKPTPS